MTSTIPASFITIPALLVSAVSAFAQGPLTPPLGAPAPTMKTLEQVEPRIPLNSTTAPGDADSLFRISQPGSYYLTGNIDGGAGRSGIEIASSGVSIDLNGFALTGVAGSLHGITTSVTLENISIRNGALRNWGGSGLSVVTLTSRFERLTATDNGGAGLSTGRGSIVSNCSAQGNGGHGIQIGIRSVITACSADDNGGDGIRTAGDNVVRSCTASDNSGNGILADFGSVVADCTASTNTLDGIKAFAGCSVSGCVAIGNLDDGIEATMRSRLIENACSSNGSGGTDAGVHLTSDENRVEANNLATNNSRGLKIDGTGNLIIRNSASGNISQDFDIPAGNSTGTIVTSEVAMNSANNSNVNISY